MMPEDCVRRPPALRAQHPQCGPAAKQRDAVLELVKSLGIPVIDIHPVFQAQNDPLAMFPFREPGHYTETGHLLVAEEVMRAISSTR